MDQSETVASVLVLLLSLDSKVAMESPLRLPDMSGPLCDGDVLWSTRAWATYGLTWSFSSKVIAWRMCEKHGLMVNGPGPIWRQ